ncbi:hypothetical protein [Novacetimonas cocois]|uniref:Uncharacterized protein n=1 Tax=Novacetimonas cocois TaxID=1747507 RepID=A0A365YV35_9PROT|nr:hypothetical protein [Novacetimonas cocois]RBM06412.1 hypothetical protein NJLHNGOC_10230 [Novacetimonas cocois]
MSAPPTEPSRQPQRPRSSSRMVVAGLLAAVVAGGFGVHSLGGASDAGGGGSSTTPTALAGQGGDTSGGSLRTVVNHTRAHADLLGEMPMIAPERAADMLQFTSFDINQKNAILAALKRHEIVLAEMPLYDMGTGSSVVSVESMGLTQIVHLTGRPRTVVLPIRIAGEVTIRAVNDPGAAGLHAGAIFVPGPTPLPVLYKDGQLVIGVVVQ